MDLTFLPLRDFVSENCDATFGDNWTTNKEKRGGKDISDHTASVDQDNVTPTITMVGVMLSWLIQLTVLVDLFWFVQKCRLLHMLKQGKIMT